MAEKQTDGTIGESRERLCSFLLPLFQLSFSQSLPFREKFTMVILFRILPYICNVHVKIVPYTSVKHIFLFSLFFYIAEVNSLPINFGQERKRLHPSNVVSQTAVVALGSIRYPTFTCKCSGSGYRILSREKTLVNFEVL